MNSSETVFGTPFMNSEEENCPECGGIHLLHERERGEIVCTNCGLIVAMTLDTSPEWRGVFGKVDEQNYRVGDPLSVLRADYGLHTQIGGTRRDSSGNILGADAQAKMRRLKRINGRIKHSKQRNLLVALREIKRLCSQLSLPRQVTENAAIYYRQVLKKELVRGRSIDGITAAVVYLAARNHETILTIQDLLQVARVEQKEIGRCVRVIIGELEMKTSPTNPKNLIHRLGAELKLSMYTQTKAIEIIGRAKENNVTIGKNPVSIAAASLYIACVKTGERRTQQQIADAANTTPVTIRNRFKELEKKLNIDNLEVKRGAAAVPVYWSL